jgi:hypothetical protein
MLYDIAPGMLHEWYVSDHSPRMLNLYEENALSFLSSQHDTTESELAAQKWHILSGDG